MAASHRPHSGLVRKLDKKLHAPDRLKGSLPQAVLDAAACRSRIEVLHSLDWRTLNSQDFENLSRLAAEIFKAPFACISLVDDEVTRIFASYGEKRCPALLPNEMSFSVHMLEPAHRDVMLVDQLQDDARFAFNRFVTGEPHFQFFAGAPIEVRGEIIAVLSILDYKPRLAFSEEQINQLRILASLVSSLFTSREAARHGDLARDALVREEKRHSLALDAANIASWVWDTRTNIIDCDPLLPKLYGLKPSNRIRLRDIIACAERSDLRSAHLNLDSRLDSEEDLNGTFRIRGTNPIRWIVNRGRVLDRDDEAKPTKLFGVSFDVTEIKTADERQRLLLRELNHRVKNTLATVQALATQTVRHAHEPREFLQAFSVRLQALGRAHNLLSDNEWGGIKLTEVLRTQALPFMAKAAPRISFEGNEVLISPDQALALGLVIHELASNAIKYGSLSVATGRVELSWYVENIDGKRLKLHWVETGGPHVEPPTRSGFGAILINRSLDKILASEVTHEFLPNGVEARICIPLTPQ